MIKWGRTLQTQLIFHRIGFVFFFTVRDRFFWGPDLELFAADIVYLSFNNFNQLFGSSWRNCLRSPAFHKLFQFRIADGPWDWFTIICAEHWELGESSLYGTCPNQNQQLRFQAEIQVNQKGGRFKSWGPAMCHRRVRCLDRRFSLSLRYPSLTMGSRILNIRVSLSHFFFLLSFSWQQVCSRSLLCDVCRQQGGTTQAAAESERAISLPCALNNIRGTWCLCHLKGELGFFLAFSIPLYSSALVLCTHLWSSSVILYSVTHFLHLDKLLQFSCP